MIEIRKWKTSGKLNKEQRISSKKDGKITRREIKQKKEKRRERGRKEVRMR
jgi:hypothetical protein